MNSGKNKWKVFCFTMTAFCCILCLSNLGLSAPPQQPPPARVKITHVTEQDMQKKTKLIGVLYFDKISGVSTEVNGLVKSIAFREGNKVKKGDILVRLNTDFLKKDLALEKINLQRVDIRIEQKNKNLKRFEKLLEKEAASEVDYEDLFFSYQELIKEKKGLQIKIDRINLEIAKSVIKAPFDGLIMKKYVDSGNWIQQGDSICQIGSTDDLFLQVPVAEKLLKFVQTGDAIDLVINVSNKQMTGKVEGIRPIADEKTKNIFLKIRLPYMELAIENMSATVFMPISEKQRLKMVPRDALVKFQGKNFVYTIQDNQAQIVPLNIVTMSGAYIGVDNPEIQPGMPVVVDGNERLRPDQPVVVVGEN
ncbi:MAG: efflux RND transporter periplasmic adaptor subunit [Deltaproteobacteria bacterium]|nr:efflux RND transporter periplasmic adaptor subunit [Deltaproteobacteria bacterium]